MLSEHDLYYLRSCLTNLRNLQTIVMEDAYGPTIQNEALSDNIDWLDCFIDQQERAASVDTRPKDEDATQIAASLASGAVGEAETPNASSGEPGIGEAVR